jgi:hypothetical protein
VEEEQEMGADRRQVLQMLAEGKITVEEADRLIAALDREQPATPAAEAGEARLKARPKYLRVLVESADHFGGDGPGKVNVRVPMQLLRAGVKLASLLPPRALEHANEALRKQGVPIDLTQIKPQHIEELIEQLDDMTVDVDQPDVKVKIFAE